MTQHGMSARLNAKLTSFRYKHDIDPDGIPQFGLVAEQVKKVNPDLVVRGEDGKVMTVRYEAVNAMLLNEFLKEHRQVEEQKAGFAKMKSVVSKQEELIAKQQKQIEALTATVRKVSERVELSAPAPQIAANED
jgi:polyhydroxyalkanoate synthesis regulator phasin